MDSASLSSEMCAWEQRTPTQIPSSPKFAKNVQNHTITLHKIFFNLSGETPRPQQDGINRLVSRPCLNYRRDVRSLSGLISINMSN